MNPNLINDAGAAAGGLLDSSDMRAFDLLCYEFAAAHDKVVKALNASRGTWCFHPDANIFVNIGSSNESQRLDLVIETELYTDQNEHKYAFDDLATLFDSLAVYKALLRRKKIRSEVIARLERLPSGQSARVVAENGSEAVLNAPVHVSDLDVLIEENHIDWGCLMCDWDRLVLRECAD